MCHITVTSWFEFSPPCYYNKVTHTHTLELKSPGWSFKDLIYCISIAIKGECRFFFSSEVSHQRLFVLHQSDDLHRLLLQVVIEVVWQRREYWVKVLLGHCVVG